MFYGKALTARKIDEPDDVFSMNKHSVWNLECTTSMINLWYKAERVPKSFSVLPNPSK